MNLRPYQLTAKSAVQAQWKHGTKKTLLVQATGTGKTVVFAALTSDIVRTGGRVLILAHRGELLQQAANKLARSSGLMCAVEKADQTAHDSSLSVVVGSIQTLSRGSRMERYAADHFTHVIVDEAHHALSPSYLSVLNYFTGADILGVTATADRGDKRNLGEFFETVAYEYPLNQAVRDGWLVRPSALTLPVMIDLSGVKMTSGDFNAEAVGHALDPYLADIADQMASHCADRKTVVFLPLIATSQKFEALLRDRGMNVREVNGESEDRKEKLAWFDTAPAGAVLCNSMILTEGWDSPSCDCICVLRPTRVRSLYAQMVGRGTRPHDSIVKALGLATTAEDRHQILAGSPKPNLIILDFLWHTDRHDLCRPASLICQNPDIAERVSQIMAEESLDGQQDLLEMEEGAESKAQEEREEALRKMLEEQRHRQKKLVDPLQYEASITGGRLDEYLPDHGDLRALAPPSAKQLAALEKAGIFPEGVMCAGHASRILDTIKLRRAEGLSTPKQIRCLEKYGFKDVGTWEFEGAKHLIDQIAGSMWRVPSRINPATYKPEPSPPSRFDWSDTPTAAEPPPATVKAATGSLF